MNIRQATQADSDNWDKYVLNHPDAAHTHLWGWKNVIEQTYNKKAYYFVAEQEGKFVGVLPIFHIKSVLFGNELVSMPYSTYGGVLADSSDIQKKLIEDVITLSEEKETDTIKLRQTQQLKIENQFEYKIAEDSSKVSMHLELSNNSEEQFGRFKAKLRSQIRRPQKEGMTFKMGSSELTDDFYKVFVVNMRDLGSPVHAKGLFTNLCDNFKDTVKIGVVYYNSEPVAAGIITIMKNMVEIPWASSLRKYNRLSPNMLLYWSFLEYCCNSGITTFDFGRSTMGEGTYRFKEQWGAQPQSISWFNIQKNSLQSMPGADQGSKKLFAYFWSKIPASISKQIGPVIRKQISL